jgi:predicted outer membrane repeat protein
MSVAEAVAHSGAAMARSNRSSWGGRGWGWSKFSAVLLLGCAPVAVHAGTIYVRQGATGAGTGASWADAYTDLDAALAASVAGDEIWVAEGTYPAPAGTAGFVLRSGVGVYGGFAGTETRRTQRNPVVHTTILDGRGTRVLTADGVNSATVIDGFSIVGAFASVSDGGGMRCVGGSPTVSNCVFADNLTGFAHGGAVALLNSNATITHCTFSSNRASQGSGGAIYVGGTSSPTIRDCSFLANEVVATNGQTGQGGAIHIDTTAPITIARCVFDGNIARPFGSGGNVEIPRGGAISCFSPTDPTTTIRECVFRNNRSANGGAIFVWNPTTILNCSFDHNIAQNYLGAQGQTVGGEGAGVCIQWTTATLVNCTIVNNNGRESGGISVLEFLPNFPSLAIVRNSIIWGNAATAPDVSVRNPSIRGPFEAEFSCIQHLFSSDPGDDPIDPADYPGCIISDPLLVAAGSGDVRLSPASPCIDAAHNAFVPAGTPVDLDGNTRIVRGLPGPGIGTVDMGAFEFGSRPCVPVITLHPTNASTCRSGVAILSVLAAPDGGPFTYAWRFDGLPIDPVANPSAATATLSLSNVTAVDAGPYDCVVTNACGSVASNPATLIVCVADVDDGSGAGACDGGVTIDDLLYYIRLFEDGSIAADLDDGSGSGIPDAGVTIDDLLYYLFRFEAGC